MKAGPQKESNSKLYRGPINRVSQRVAYTSVCGLLGVLLSIGITATANAMNKHFCQILVTQPGMIGVRYDSSAMGSTEAGGQPAYANVSVSNSSFRIALDGPYGFIQMPPNGDTGVTFSTGYSGTGATNFSETPGTIPVKLKKGDSRIAVNMSAKKNSNAFPAGFYSAQVTLRCE